MSSTIKNVLCKTCLILIIGLTFLTVSYAHAQQQTVVLHVDGDNGLAVPNPPDPGDTWSNAYKYLPDALDRAEFLILNDPEVDAVDLWVAATVPSNPYRPDRDASEPFGTGDRAATFFLDFNNVQVLGGFAGNETDPADRDPAVNITVLSGELTFGVCGDPDAGDCFVANGTPGCNDATCCEAVCAVDPDCCEVAWDPDCVDFANDVCLVCGVPGSGSCFEPNDTPGCEDADCCALVCADDPICCILPWDQLCADAAIMNCPSSGNRAYHVVTADGVDDSVRIDGFTVTGGLADQGLGSTGLGAGMFILNASPAVVRVTFTENSAPGHGGGAMHIQDASHPLVVNCHFFDNDGAEGGAIHSEFGSAGATLVNCLFAGNIATGNQGDHGGAIDHGITSGVMVVTNCTFTDNTADLEGGAIFLHKDGEAVITNSILWNNSPDEIVEGDPNLATVNYSDVEGGWTGNGSNNIGEDPADDPLFVDPGNGDYRLDALSPCIDKGNPDETVIPVDEFDVDQDGDMDEPTPDLDLNDRLIDTEGSCSVGRVDMGAYEAPPCCPVDMDNNGNVGATDLLALLVAWGSDPGGPPDFDCNGVVGATDLLALLVNWGPCPCGASTIPLTLEEELADACLTMDDWDEFVDVMTDPESSQEDKDRYNCWMIHYLDHCNRCTCPHLPECPSPDPFN